MKRTITNINAQALAPATQDFNISMFSEAWEEWTRDRSETTRRGYNVTIKAFLYWIQEEGITRPQRSDIIRYREYLNTTHTSRLNGKPVLFTADTQARYFRGVKMFFSFLEAAGLYKDITKNIRSPKTNPAEFKRDYLEKEDILTILRSIDTRGETNKRNYALILTIILCGLRVIEISRANIGDIEKKGKERRLYIQGKGHDTKDTYKKIEPVLYEAIQDYLKMRDDISPEAPLFAAVGNNAKPGGGRLNVTSISRIVKTVLIKAGYNSKRLTAHSLRHTSITLDRKAGATIEEAQRHARHTSIVITQRYDHLLEKAEAQDEARIVNYLFSKEEEADTDTKAARILEGLSEEKKLKAIEILEALRG